MEVRALGEDEAAVLRDIRLRALTTDPSAFGSTLAREEARSLDDWAARLGPPVVTFVAGSPDPLGMAWGVPDAGDDGLVHLYGMWVAPTARRRGAGTALVDAVIRWATARGAERVELTVVEGNDGAERLYARHGFVRTGATERRPRDGLVEAQMIRTLG